MYKKDHVVPYYMNLDLLRVRCDKTVGVKEAYTRDPQCNYGLTRCIAGRNSEKVLIVNIETLYREHTRHFRYVTHPDSQVRSKLCVLKDAPNYFVKNSTDVEEIRSNSDGNT